MKATNINYIEFTTNDINAVKAFYSEAFGWKFTDYGTDYVAFENSGIAGGFVLSKEPVVNGVLIVLYHENLESILKTVELNGGTIVKDIFSFPGGRRFHFIDPTGNELAIWSDN